MMEFHTDESKINKYGVASILIMMASAAVSIGMLVLGYKTLF